MEELLTGKWGLAITAGAAVVPACLGYYRKLYAISVGYGLSVAGAAGVVLTASPSTLAAIHGVGVVCHGVRLAAFLLRREREILARPKASKEWKTKIASMEGDGSVSFKELATKRTPFVLSVALLYTCMAAPVLFHFKTASRMEALTCAGLGLQWLGWIYNAVADWQKSAYKRRLGDDASWCSSGLYAFSRHPNYFGEQTFWLGTFLAGVPSYTSAWQWGVAALGLVGIQGIMSGATKRLDAKQKEKYGNNPNYQDYLKKTNCSVPRLF